MKIWILTCKFGQGHFSVAKALEEEFTDNGHEVIVSDIVELLHPRYIKTIYYVFNKIICRSGLLYNFINGLGRSKKSCKNDRKAITIALDKIKPDRIVTTWSACARILCKIKVPIYVYITDVGVHEGWICDNVQGYFVASSDVKRKLISMGVDRDKIKIRGIPVKKSFNMSNKKATFKKKILIMGGGLGILPWIEDAIKDLSDYSELDITVITGKNKKLYKKLSKKYPYVKVIGFTKEVHQYMSETDLLVSKPGGVSLFEGIYTETPCIAVYPQYKHEIENAAFITDKEIGEVIWKDEDIGEAIINLFKDEERYEKYKKNIIDIKREIRSERRLERWGMYDDVI